MSIKRRKVFEMQSEDNKHESGRQSRARQVTFRAQADHVMTRHKETWQPPNADDLCVLSEEAKEESSCFFFLLEELEILKRYHSFIHSFI